MTSYIHACPSSWATTITGSSRTGTIGDHTQAISQDAIAIKNKNKNKKETRSSTEHVSDIKQKLRGTHLHETKTHSHLIPSLRVALETTPNGKYERSCIIVDLNASRWHVNFLAYDGFVVETALSWPRKCQIESQSWEPRQPILAVESDRMFQSLLHVKCVRNSL